MRDRIDQAATLCTFVALSVCKRTRAWLAGLLLAAACNGQSPPPATGDEAAGAAAAVDALEDSIDNLNRQFGAAFWVAETYPSRDARAVSAAVEAMMRDNHAGGLVQIERRFGNSAHEGAHARKLLHLAHRFEYPLPGGGDDRDGLARRVQAFAQRFENLELCYRGACFTPAEAERRMQTSDDHDERAALWQALRREAAGLGEPFNALRAALNAAARDWGYDDLGHWQAARYERPSRELGAALEQLTDDLEPLAGPLRCHVATALDDGRKDKHVSAPALRSLWGRDWTHLHDALRRKLPPHRPLLLDVEGRFDTVEAMVRWAESAYRSAGFPPLPGRFWSASQFVRPTRAVSACPRFGTNVDWVDDVRLTMCGERNRGDLVWSHGMLAFLYYDLAFAGQNWVFRDPPHLGFHFANSDAMELALTPEYLQQQGLLATLPTADERLSQQLHDALRILPRIGYDIAAARWQWQAFGTSWSREQSNARWRRLRKRHQGVTTPPAGADDAEALAHEVLSRPAELLPGALGQVLAFQFYAEACASAGHDGPLYSCSFYGNDAVATRLWPILEKGASEPWYDVLEAYTGSPHMSAAPLLEYFAPLRRWLADHGADGDCVQTGQNRS